MFGGRAGSRGRQSWAEGSEIETGKTGRVLCGLPESERPSCPFPGPGGVLPLRDRSPRSPFGILFAALVSEALARDPGLCRPRSKQQREMVQGPAAPAAWPPGQHRARPSSSQHSWFTGAALRAQRCKHTGGALTALLFALLRKSIKTGVLCPPKPRTAGLELSPDT